MLQMASVRKPDTFFTKMPHKTFMIKITLSFWGEKGDKCVLCGQISECWALRWPAGITDFRFILQDSVAKYGFSLSNNNAGVDQFCCCLCFVAKTLQGFCISSIHSRRLCGNTFSHAYNKDFFTKNCVHNHRVHGPLCGLKASSPSSLPTQKGWQISSIRFLWLYWGTTSI